VSAVAAGWVLAGCLVWATPAAALNIGVPPDLTGPTDVSVTLSPGDPVGPVLLWDEDLALGSLTATGGVAVFDDVSLPAGAHVLRANVRSDTVSVTSTETGVYSWSAPGAPTWDAPGSKAVISPCTVSVHAGASTATLTLTVNGKVVGAAPCRPGQLLTFKGVKLTSHKSSVTVTEESRTGESTGYSRNVTRYEFPYSTCIVIDKSEFRLYWVKNQQLIKKYPIAHGRHNWTPVGVWKVGAKYKTSGIYGPRKMRMFRRVGRRGHYRYIYTRYGIHGTNQPWVIGTMASHGCIRMYDHDVLELWPQVRIGTFVVTRK
jgi:lipoprotein-anchoring transpeptidase ErfK/SrfK